MYTLNTDPAQIMKKRPVVAKEVIATASPLAEQHKKKKKRINFISLLTCRVPLQEGKVTACYVCMWNDNMLHTRDSRTLRNSHY